MVDGLTPVMPSGALYMMVGVELSKFPHINTTVEFMEKLMSEESIFILCGEVGALSIIMYAAYNQVVSVVFPIPGVHQTSASDTKRQNENSLWSYQRILLQTPRVDTVLC